MSGQTNRSGMLGACAVGGLLMLCACTKPIADSSTSGARFFKDCDTCP